MAYSILGSYLYILYSCQEKQMRTLHFNAEYLFFLRCHIKTSLRLILTMLGRDVFYEYKVLFFYHTIGFSESKDLLLIIKQLF